MFAGKLGLRMQADMKKQSKRISLGLHCRNPGGNEAWKYASYKSRLARQLRGSAPWTRENERVARRSWVNECKTLDETVRAEFRRTAKLPQRFSKTINASDKAPASAQIFDLVDLSDDIWPLARETLLKHVEAHAAKMTLDHRGGFMKVAKSMREELRPSLVVEASPGFPSAKLQCKLTCFERHPGVCASRDAETFEAILQLASKVHQYFHSEAGGFGHFYTFSATGGAVSTTLHVVYAGTRVRNPPMCVFARVYESGDDGRLALCIADDRLVFSTSWEVCKHLLTDERTLNVTVSKVHHVSMSALSVQVVPQEVAAHELWRKGEHAQDEHRWDKRCRLGVPITGNAGLLGALIEAQVAQEQRGQDQPTRVAEGPPRPQRRL